MPEYLAPGVYIEEVSFRSKSIEGVGTSVAAIAGPTRFGPVRGVPEVLTSFADFTRIYGDSSPISFDNVEEPNYTAIAAKAFFDNGGKQLFVARIVHGGNESNASGINNDPDSPTVAQAKDGAGVVNFSARYPGSGGNFTLELRWRDSENLLRNEEVNNPSLDEVVLLTAPAVPKEAKVKDSTLDDNKFPIKVSALVKLVQIDDPADPQKKIEAFAIQGNAAEITDKSNVAVTDFANTLKGHLIRSALGDGVTLNRVKPKTPAGGKLTADTPMVLTLNGKIQNSLKAYTNQVDWGTLTTLRGSYDPVTNRLSVPKSQNPDIPQDFVLPLPALAARANAASSILALRSFDLDVLNAGEPIFSFTKIDLSPDSDRSLEKVLTDQPSRRSDILTQPISCKLKAGSTSTQVLDALYGLFDGTAASPDSKSGKSPRFLIKMKDGSDGKVPGAVDYGGEEDQAKGSTGFTSFELVEDISIVMAPAAAAHDDTHLAVISQLRIHCAKMRYRVGVIEAGQAKVISEVRDFAGNIDDNRMALYYPWVVIPDPTGKKPEITVPPAGFIAGVYANTDVIRGVHKAPANEPILGVLRPELEINRFQQELLNPDGINCLRSFPNRGFRVWGGRTRSSDPEWKYVNVRRYFLYLERSIDKSTQWAVFEPNGELLWGNVRSAVDDFLFNEWKNGRLLGGTPKAAYFVRCDRSTMTQNDIDNGRLVCLVGVAPLRPAEFVIFRIGQKTADA